MMAAPSVDETYLEIGRLTAIADRSGVLYLPQERILAVADLHLEKGSAFAKRGAMLPPYDTRETLDRLAETVDRLSPRTVIALGDTWHDRGGPDRIDPAVAAAFAAMRRNRNFIFVNGNHDPAPPAGLGETVAETLVIGDVTFRHEPMVDPGGAEIAGHLHPAAKVTGRGRAVRRRCFAANRTRCILPAFGALAGGLNVLDPAFAPLFKGTTFMALMLGRDRVYSVGRASLRPD